jgi:hypothetical protein
MRFLKLTYYFHFCHNLQTVSDKPIWEIQQWNNFLTDLEICHTQIFKSLYLLFHVFNSWLHLLCNISQTGMQTNISCLPCR